LMTHQPRLWHRLVHAAQTSDAVAASAVAKIA
jgi:hypothetical protein